MPSDFFNQKSEVGFLSLVLKDYTLIDRASDIVPNMLSSSPNKALYNTLLDMHSRNIVIDYNMLVAELTSKSSLDSVGGESYLQYLLNQNNDPSHMDEFKKHIIASYKASTLLRLSNEVPAMLGNMDNIDDVISYVNNTVQAVNSCTGVDDVRSMEYATKETWDYIIERLNSDNKIPRTTGLKSLDAVTGGYSPGDLWIIAGRPSMGKSSFMCESLLSGIPSLAFSLEMPRITLIERLISIQTGVPVLSMKMGTLTQIQLDLIADSMAKIRTLPIYIDSNYYGGIDYIVSKARKYIKENDVKVIHLDYLQLLSDRDADATSELGRITRQLKFLANEYGATCVAYSQLNRLVESREDKRPILSDLRQSGNIEEDADVVVAMYRDSYYNKNTKLSNILELLIRKQRNGPVGTVSVKFDETTSKIYEG